MRRSVSRLRSDSGQRRADRGQRGAQLRQGTLDGRHGGAHRGVLVASERAVGRVRDLIEIVADATELDVKAGQIDPPVNRRRPGERRLA